MKKLLWKLLEMIDTNHGYSTPLQKRFEIGDVVRLTDFKLSSTLFEIGSYANILETGRHDYLIVQNGVKQVVYQFEIESGEDNIL